MFLKDESHPSAEPKPASPEVLEDHAHPRLRLMEQARELERLRRQVRASAEREAAAIVTNARRDVRQVLLEARRELLVLVAQLQAVGCDSSAETGSRDVMEGHATSSIASASPTEGSEGFEVSIATGARRDVREVLIEAQNELVALAEEARELRARIAREQALPAPADPPKASIADVPDRVIEFPSERPEVSAVTPDVAAADSPAEPEIFESVPERPAEPTPLSSEHRVWIAVAAAVIFAAIGLGAFLISNGRTRPSPVAPASAADADPRGAIVKQTAANPLAPPPAPVGTTAAPAASASANASVGKGLSARVDVRRPVWLRATIDGRPDVGRLYNAGETRTITAKDEIVMRAGDAGAVLVSVNGANPRALGPDGSVMTRRFGQPVDPEPTPAPSPQAAVPGRAVPERPLGERPSADVGTTGNSDTPAPPVQPPAEREILRATQQWFEAYFAGNVAGMGVIATPDFSLVDERGVTRRLPATMPGVDRGLQQVRIEVAGDGAVMSARLTERATVDGQRREFVSLVSGVWIRRDGQWRLTGVRFVDPASVGSLF